MANRERGEVSVSVGDRRFTLRPSFNALCNLEEITGKDIEQMLAMIDRGFISGVRAVVWTLLQDKHGDEIKTLEDAGNWLVEAGGVDAMLPILYDLLGINDDTRPAGGTAAHPPQAQGDGTGAGSGSTAFGSDWARTRSGRSRRASSSASGKDSKRKTATQ